VDDIMARPDPDAAFLLVLPFRAVIDLEKRREYTAPMLEDPRPSAEQGEDGLGIREPFNRRSPPGWLPVAVRLAARRPLAPRARIATVPRVGNRWPLGRFASLGGFIEDP
jgi:hypothetical protein